MKALLMMRNKIFTRGLLLILLALWTGLSVSHAQNTYSGLDIVFLVDQSGSMGGQAYGYPQANAGNDPLSLRFEAVQYALDTLGQYRLTLANDIPMRMAVINFGDAVDASDTTRGWIDIAPDGNQAIWDNIRVALQQALSSDDFRARNDPDHLGNTNFGAAFTAAQQLFASTPDTPDAPRLRVVVLLTDGAPCVPAQFDCESLSAQQNYFDQLTQQVQQAFPISTHRLYVLALDTSGGLWSAWESRWQQIVGAPERATRVETSQQVGVQFLNILVEVMNLIRGGQQGDVQRLTTGQNSITLPPYLREVRVSIFKSTASPGMLSVNRPDGLLLAEGDPSLTIANRDRPIEVWTITDPQPGIWTFTVGDTNDRLDVYLDLIPVDVQASVLGSAFIAGEDVTVDMLLTAAGENTPLIDYGGLYTPRVTMTLTAPDGTQTLIPMIRTPEGRYQALLQSAQAGDYQIGLEVVTQTADGQLYAIFSRADVSRFTVRDVVFEVTLPSQTNYLVGQPLLLTAYLADSSGQPLTFPQINVQAQLLTGNTTSTYPLNAIDANGNYQGEIPLVAAGTFALTVQADAVRADGQTLVLGQPFTAQLLVQQSQSVGLRRVTPLETTLTQETTIGFPPLTPNPLVLVFDVLIDGSTPASLESLGLDAANAWMIRITHDGQAIDTSAYLVRAVEGQTGRYTLDLSALDVGTFDISVGLQGALSGVLVLDTATQQIRYQVTRITSPLLIALLAGAAVLAVLIVVLVVLRILRRRRLSKHPAHGMLVIRRDGGNEPNYWTKQLDGLRSNSIVLTDAKLKAIGISKLIVTCTDNAMSQAKRVKVTAYDAKKEILFKDRLLSPGAPPVRLEKSSGGGVFSFGEEREGALPPYMLYKDPESDYGGFSLG